MLAWSGRYKLHQMSESATRRAGRPMRRMACASCATYQRQRKSSVLGPYCPTNLKGVSHFHRVLLPSRIAPLSAHFRKSPGGSRAVEL